MKTHDWSTARIEDVKPSPTRVYLETYREAMVWLLAEARWCAEAWREEAFERFADVPPLRKFPWEAQDGDLPS